MSAITHVHVRDVRDRLIDLLGWGQTYPLRDLAVARNEQLTVTFNTPAKIRIEDSQAGVIYQLHDHQTLVQRTAAGDKGGDESPGLPIEVEGNGQTIQLETYKIEDDITFEILAQKQQSGRQAYLHQSATVKVGLDTALKAWIQETPYLDPALENLSINLPRIIFYGQSIKVEIENSQEGVDYELLYFQGDKEITLSSASVGGTLHNIVLSSQPIYEDINIRIKATKTFDPSENRATQTALLNVVLPLKVRANPALSITLDPSPIIDFQQSVSLKINNTQSSASYQLYFRPIPDRDFVRQELPEAEVIKVTVPKEPDVQVLKPPRDEVWSTPEGYTAWGGAKKGNGAELTFTIDSLSQDTLIIVRAQKTHETSRPVSSAIQLEQAAVVLTKPNPVQALRLEVLLQGSQTDGHLTVSNGQPGVFYYFRTSARAKKALGLPAYFHQRDDNPDTLNKGLDQLAIEVDYVIAPPLTTAFSNLANTAPETPILKTKPLSTGTTLYIKAIKAQTRVATSLTERAKITALPQITLQDSIVDYGAFTKIIVTASQEGDKYQPLLNGTPIKRALNGNGQNLSFNTDPLTQDTEFEVRVTRPNDTSLTVDRLVRLHVTVRPESSN